MQMSPLYSFRSPSVNEDGKGSAAQSDRAIRIPFAYLELKSLITHDLWRTFFVRTKLVIEVGGLNLFT